MECCSSSSSFCTAQRRGDGVADVLKARTTASSISVSHAWRDEDDGAAGGLASVQPWSSCRAGDEEMKHEQEGRGGGGGIGGKRERFRMPQVDGVA